MSKLVNLPERLGAVAGFIRPGASVADIGTDHGYLPAYLAQRGLARKITASDISAGSLAAARRNALRHNVEEKIAFVNAPGLDGVAEADADTIVIAGVGGETISYILSRAPWTCRPGVSLVLQPQTKTGRLCRWLRINGYVITDAKLALDRRRLYIVMLASGAGPAPGCGPQGPGGEPERKSEPEPGCTLEPEPGGEPEESEAELLEILRRNNDPLLEGYLRMLAKISLHRGYP